MTSELLTGAAMGISPLLLWKVIAWFATRDRRRQDDDREDLWRELELVKREQADLRAQVAALPIRGEIERLEQRLEQRLEALTQLIMDALKR